jgi:beta-lactamase superfamily II metal-dependent hydrolase
MSLRDQRQLCDHPLTYATARVLLAGDAEEVEEGYMMSGSYTRPKMLINAPKLHTLG